MSIDRIALSKQRAQEIRDWENNWYARKLTPRPLTLEEEEQLRAEREQWNKEIKEFLEGMFWLVAGIFFLVVLGSILYYILSINHIWPFNN